MEIGFIGLIAGAFFVLGIIVGLKARKLAPPVELPEMNTEQAAFAAMLRERIRVGLELINSYQPIQKTERAAEIAALIASVEAVKIMFKTYGRVQGVFEEVFTPELLPINLLIFNYDHDANSTFIPPSKVGTTR